MRSVVKKKSNMQKMLTNQHICRMWTIILKNSDKKGLVNKYEMKTAGKAYAGMKVFHQGLCCISLASE